MRFLPSRLRRSAAMVFASSSRFRTGTAPRMDSRWMMFSESRRLYRTGPNPADHAAPHNHRHRRLERDEVREMVSGEARLRNPRAPRPLDHGRSEEGERGLPPLRGILRARARKLGGLLHLAGRQEG